MARHPFWSWHCPMRGPILTHSRSEDDPPGECAHCGAKPPKGHDPEVVGPPQHTCVWNTSGRCSICGNQMVTVAARHDHDGADEDAPWPDLSNAFIVAEPPIRPVSNTRVTYLHARRFAGLNHEEALRVVALMVGLSPAVEWKNLAEINRLVFLRTLEIVP